MLTERHLTENEGSCVSNTAVLISSSTQNFIHLITLLVVQAVNVELKGGK